MSYHVLARKWRPHTFQDMVGQEHVLQALINSLTQKRLHHAYLFTGTRGVGKTTVARILAKALNCAEGISATPCDQCDNCQNIDKGRFIDLIEVDAASRTKVEDTRELLDNVQYSPTQGRFKIYLIDEVHMLSNHSFNALLKTLEEPPSHVKFLLATTDPQKIPVTVLSRCLQFHLKNLVEPQIISHLQWVLKQEDIPYESQALNYIARAAQGSMRDALSLLDQAIAQCNQSITGETTRKMLGYINDQYTIQILEALAAHDGQQLLNISQTLNIEGGFYHRTFEELLDLLHQLTCIQLIEVYDCHDERLQQLAKQFKPEQLQLLYQICLNSHQDLSISPNIKTGFEMALLRMLAFQPDTTMTWSSTVKEEVSRQQIDTTTDNDDLKHATSDTHVNTPTHLKENTVDTIDDAATYNTGETHSIKPSSNNDIPWESLITQLEIKGMALSIAQHCQLLSHEGNTLNLGIAKSHESLLTDSITQRLNEAVNKYYNNKMKLEFSVKDSSSLDTPSSKQQKINEQKQSEAEQAVSDDQQVHKIIETFDGKIIEGSISPIIEND